MLIRRFSCKWLAVVAVPATVAVVWWFVLRNEAPNEPHATSFDIQYSPTEASAADAPTGPKPGQDDVTLDLLERFGGAALLQTRERPTGEPGVTLREHLLRPPDGRYLVRFQCVVRRDGSGTGSSIERESAMAAGRFVVRGSGVPVEEIRTALGSAGFSAVRIRSLPQDWLLVELPVQSLEGWDQAMLAWDSLEHEQNIFVEPDYLSFLAVQQPNDPRYIAGDLWGLNNLGQIDGLADADIDAPEAWGIRSDASSVVVGVVDSGIRYTHEDLAGNMWINEAEVPGDGIDNDGNGVIDDVFGYNALHGSGDPMDDNGHGTHVAGTIGAIGDNGVGVTGIAWEVRLMALKCFNAQGWGLHSDIVEAVDYAVEHGAQILNNSWGSSWLSQLFHDSFAAAQNEGVLLVCAAGNSSQSTDGVPFYPAAFDLENVISVGSGNRRDEVSSFSNYGTYTVDLFAPGSDILSTTAGHDSEYSSYSGTSMAAPHVSGTLALLMVEYPLESNARLLGRLLGGADRMDAYATKARSDGRLNVHGSLSLSERFPLPVFETNLEPLVVAKGAAATLTVEIASSSVVEYQWFKDGVPLSNSNGSSYVVGSVDEDTFGEYVVVARNALGVTRSRAALVDFTRPPSIVTQPSGAIVQAGGYANFRVRVSGTAPFQYQWYVNGAPIEGATSESLGLHDVDESRVGNYWVEVSNALGSVASRVVRLGFFESGNLELWEGLRPQPMSSNKYGLCYGEGLFVAVGSSGEIHTSIDGVEWEPHIVASRHRLVGVEYLSDGFYAVGEDGTLLHSADGCRWRAIDSGTTTDLKGIAEGAGLKVVFGNTTIRTSVDGQVWRESHFPGRLRSITFANGHFVAVSIDGQIATSNDGLSWETAQIEGGRFFAAAYGQGRWVVVGTKNGIGTAMISEDAVSWVEAAGFEDSVDYYDVVFGDKGFVAVGAGSQLAYSPDGLVWSGAARMGMNQINAVAHGAGRYACVGLGGIALATEIPWAWSMATIAELGYLSRVESTSSGYHVWGGYPWDRGLLYSKDGAEWQLVTTPNLGPWIGVAQIGGLTLALSDRGGVARSEDGIRWEAANGLAGMSWRAVASGGGSVMAIAVPEDGGVASLYQSSDGNGWQEVRSFDPDFEFASLEYLDSVWYAGGKRTSSGDEFIMRSEDGQVWEELEIFPRPTGSSVNRLLFGNGVYVARSGGRNFLRSENGLDWEYISTSYGSHNIPISFGNGAFFRANEPGLWETSEDAKNWSQYSVKDAQPVTDFTYGNGGFVLTREGELARSNNGFDWVEREVQPRSYPYGIFEGDGLVATVDQFARIALSKDGTEWEYHRIPGSVRLRDGAYGNDRYVVVGTAPTGEAQVHVSDNGITWRIAETWPVHGLYTVDFLGGKFVGVGSRVAAVSPDGEAWEIAYPEAFENWYHKGLAYGEGVYVTTGVKEDPLTYESTDTGVFSSQDGKTWTLRSSIPSSNSGTYSDVAYGNGLFVAIGNHGMVATSDNGIDWEHSQLSLSGGVAGVVCYGDGRFVMPGRQYNGYSSPDGVTWTTHRLNVGDYFLSGMIYSQGAFWVTGTYNSVFRSVSADLQEPPEAASLMMAFSSASGDLPLDVISEAVATVPNDELQISTVGEPEVGAVSVAESGTPCELGDDYLRYGTDVPTGELRDEFGYRLANRLGFESDLAVIALERLPDLTLEKRQTFRIQKELDLVYFAPPADGGFRIRAANLQSGAGMVDLFEGGVRFSPGGSEKCVLEVEATSNGTPAILTLEIQSIRGTTAVDDRAVAKVDRPATLDVLQNDLLSDSRAATVDLIGQPQFGALERRENGVYDYTPAAGFVGMDRFRYRLTDAFEAVSEAEVSIRVVDDFYLLWRETAFASHPELDGNPQADPLGTGITNVERYLFGIGLFDQGGRSRPAPDLTLYGERLEIEFSYVNDDGLVALLELWDEDEGWRLATSERDDLQIEQIENWTEIYPMQRQRFTIGLGEPVRILRIRIQSGSK